MAEMMKLLKASQNTAYRARRELLKHYHEQEDSRASQWGIDTTAEEAYLASALASGALVRS